LDLTIGKVIGVIKAAGILLNVFGRIENVEEAFFSRQAA